MFGFLKDNKPEILKQINNAIIEENKRLSFEIEHLINKLNSGEIFSDMEISQYIINIELNSPIDGSYEKEMKEVENASSREMFQALNKISPDAKYNVDNDSASGTVKGYNIFLMRHKGFGKEIVVVSASYNKTYELIQNIIAKHNKNKDTSDIPSFINELME